MIEPWHTQSAAEVARQLDSRPEAGLDEADVASRRSRHGYNRLTPAPGKPAWLRFLLQFNQPLVIVLLVSAAITAAFQEWVDAAVIFGVTLVNAIIGYLQEVRAEGAIAALARALATDVTVLRAGSRRRLPAEELVPGDVVLLAAGDRVPADLRLFHAREMQANESTLTGESQAVDKQHEVVTAAAPLAERSNMAYTGSTVTRGQGAGLVVAIGDATETGRISRLIAGAPAMTTPLTRKMATFSGQLLWVIGGLALFTAAVGIFRGESAFEMFMSAVALAVGAIPEGLPAAVTITLAVGVARMAKRHAIIRHLPAVETLGSTTVICSDKTGTLTENAMTVREVFAGGRAYPVSGAGYAPDGRVGTPGAPDVAAEVGGALGECLLAGALCNDAALAREGRQWTIVGDPTEAALLVVARKAGLDSGSLGLVWPRQDELPFDSGRQFMATLHAGEGIRVGFVKGAVERLLPMCAMALDERGDPAPLDAATVLREAEAMAGRGLRVLAFARLRPAPDETALAADRLAGRLDFLGLMGMIDPPRPKAVAAVRVCHRAGITVKMITGDHAATALAIARQIGIAGSGTRVLTGAELALLDADGLRAAARETAVFARVEPEQKLRLVEALQAGGEIVAMTGDGVNDAPALKSADIGIAMGLAGTEVAKEAAAMVLVDDDFATIEAAVEEGRGVWDNVVKFVTWTLPTNFGEGLVIVAAIVAGVTLPITPLQILWINMTTAVLLGLPLAFEPIEAGVMQRPPRPPRAPVLNVELVLRIVLVGIMMLAGSFGLFLHQLDQGHSLAEARTMAVNAFVMIEVFYLFNCRSLTRSCFAVGFFSNGWVWVGIAATLGLQLLQTYLPAMNRVFATAPIGWREWLVITAVGWASSLVVGAEKWLRSRPGSRR